MGNKRFVLNLFSFKIISVVTVASMLMSNAGAMKPAKNVARNFTSCFNVAEVNMAIKKASALFYEAMGSPKKACIAFILARASASKILFLKYAGIHDEAFFVNYNAVLQRNDEDMDVAENVDKDFFDRLETFYCEHEREFNVIFVLNTDVLNAKIASCQVELSENQDLLNCVYAS